MIDSAISPPTVFIIDSDRHSRRKLESLVGNTDISIKTYSSPRHFLKDIHEETSGCVVIDLKTNGQNSPYISHETMSDHHRMPVIFITAYAEVATAVSAMKAGAFEFLERPVDPHAFTALIHNAVEIDAQQRRKDREYLRLDRQIRTLNSRDRETLDLIIAGQSNKGLCLGTGITERAVEMRRAAIMKKLNVRTFADLLDMAITHRTLSRIRGSRGIDSNALWPSTAVKY